MVDYQRTLGNVASPESERETHRTTLIEATRHDRRTRSVERYGQAVRTGVRRLLAALRYVWRSDRPIRTLLFGGVIQVFAFGGAYLAALVFVGLEVNEEWTAVFAIAEAILLLPVLGYLVFVIQRRMAGDPNPPEFGDWRNALRVGVDVAVITVVFQLFVYTIVGFVSWLGVVRNVQQDIGLLFSNDFGIESWNFEVYLVTTVLFFVYPAVIVTYAKRERLSDVVPGKDGFNYRDVFSDRNYAGIAALIILLQFVRMEFVVPATLYYGGGLFPVVWLVGGVVSFYLLTAMYFIAGSYWETVQPGRGDRRLLRDDTVQVPLSAFTKRTR